MKNEKDIMRKINAIDLSGAAKEYEIWLIFLEYTIQTNFHVSIQMCLRFNLLYSNYVGSKTIEMRNVSSL